METEVTVYCPFKEFDSVIPWSSTRFPTFKAYGWVKTIVIRVLFVPTGISDDKLLIPKVFSPPKKKKPFESTILNGILEVFLKLFWI